MNTNRRPRCSGWAQQGSNLRPLGEQRTVYQGCSTPGDLAEHQPGVYQGVRRSTQLTAEKVTDDLGRAVELVGALIVFVPLYVLAVLLDRQDRKGGTR